MPPKRRSAASVPTSVVSKVHSEEKSARWEIQGFSMIEKKKGIIEESGAMLEVAGTWFSLHAGWGGSEESPLDHISVHLAIAEDSPSKKAVDLAMYKIRVLNHLCEERNIELEFDGPTYRLDADHFHGNNAIGKLSDLLSRNTGFLVQDCLIVELTVRLVTQRSSKRMYGAPGQVGGGAGASDLSPKSVCSVTADLAALLASGEGADVALSGKSDQDEAPVRAHRAVLAARSPVLRSMLLTSGMKEASPDASVTLEGTDPAVVRWFVQFLYTDTLDAQAEADSDALCHLLFLAHRYEVQALVQACSEKLTSRLSEENAVDMLMMSEQLGILTFKKEVFEYLSFCRSRLARLQRKEPFRRMAKHYPQLIMDLLAEVVQPPDKRPRERAGSGAEEGSLAVSCA